MMIRRCARKLKIESWQAKWHTVFSSKTIKMTPPPLSSAILLLNDTISLHLQRWQAISISTKSFTETS